MLLLVAPQLVQLDVPQHCILRVRKRHCMWFAPCHCSDKQEHRSMQMLAAHAQATIVPCGSRSFLQPLYTPSPVRQAELAAVRL